MITSEEKRYLRESLITKRMHLSPTEIRTLSKKITDNVISNTDWQKINNIYLYLPITKNNEVNTWPLIDFIRESWAEITIYTPKLNGIAELTKDSKTITNKLGFPEPETDEVSAPKKFDLIIVPTLGFDRRGYRLGYGGGYYDRFLKTHKYGETIGLAYEFCGVDSLPVEKHDQKLDKIITEEEIILTSS